MNCSDCGKQVIWYFVSLDSILCRECGQKDPESILPGNYWYTHSDLTLDDEETQKPDLGRPDVD